MCVCECVCMYICISVGVCTHISEYLHGNRLENNVDMLKKIKKIKK